MFLSVRISLTHSVHRSFVGNGDFNLFANNCSHLPSKEYPIDGCVGRSHRRSRMSLYVVRHPISSTFRKLLLIYWRRHRHGTRHVCDNGWPIFQKTSRARRDNHNIRHRAWRCIHASLLVTLYQVRTERLLLSFEIYTHYHILGRLLEISPLFDWS